MQSGVLSSQLSLVDCIRTYTASQVLYWAHGREQLFSVHSQCPRLSLK